MVQTREERLKKKRESAKKYRDNNKDKKKEYCQNNKEQIAEYKREYYQNNKEHMAEQNREYYQNNKEQLAEKHREYYENNKEQIIEKHREYQQTPAAKKARTMDSWRRMGVINVNDEMYNHYIASTHCECCSKEFSSSRDRHLDHDHETGEYRWVICCSCNNHDNWKKITH